MTMIAPPATLADIAVLVEADPDLLPLRRRDLLSALRCFCRVLGIEPRHAAASHAFFRKRLADFHPVQAGISEKTFQNMRAGVGAALERYVRPEPRILAGRLPAAWDELRGKLAIGHERAAFSRLFRYCAERGIPPDAVDDAMLAGFRDWVEQETFVKHPALMLTHVIRAWNKVAERIDGWPQTRLSPRPRQETYTLAWEAMPASLRQDIDAWLSRSAAPDPLDDEGPAKPLRPATIVLRRRMVRQMVSALHHKGISLTDLASLADVVRPDRAQLILRFFLARNDNKPSPTTGLTADMMLVIARHWARLPDEDLAELARLRGKVAVRQKGLRAKNRERLRQFDSARNTALLLALPGGILAEKLRLSAPARKDAFAVQGALAVEILLTLPLRMENLHRLHLDRHFRRQRDRGRTRIFIVVPEEEVKNAAPIEAELTPECAALLDTYLQRFHPLLASTGNRWLFPSTRRTDSHKSKAMLADQVRALVFDHTGLRVNPHLFRHIAAKLYLDANPGGYEVMRRVLGHRSMETTANFYAGLEAASAARHFNDTILKLRHAGSGHD